MSGPRARMGQARLIEVQRDAPDTLCPFCYPSPGWGWAPTDEQLRIDEKYGDPNGLPAPGNGYRVSGPCRSCNGTGRKKNLNYAKMARTRCIELDHGDEVYGDHPCDACINYIVLFEREITEYEVKLAVREELRACLEHFLANELWAL